MISKTISVLRYTNLKSSVNGRNVFVRIAATSAQVLRKKQRYINITRYDSFERELSYTWIKNSRACNFDND